MEHKILKHEGYQMDVAFKVKPNAVKVSKDKIVKDYKQSKKPAPPLEQLMKMSYRDTMEKTFQKFLRETGYLNLTRPRFKLNEAHPAKGMSFQMRVSVHPPLKLPDYSLIEMEVPEIPIPSEDMLMSKLIQMQFEVAEEKNIQRPVQINDKVSLDYRLSKDGKPIPLSARSQMEERLTRDIFTPGLGDKIVGMQPGESRELTITLPQDFYDPALRGQTALCQVTLHKAVELLPPPLTNEFPKYYDLDMNYEAFMQHVYDLLLENNQQAWLQAVKTQLLDLIAENTPTKIPRGLIENVMKSAWEETDAATLKAQGVSDTFLEADKQAWMASPAIQAEYQDKVKKSLLINAIALKENLKIKPGDLLVILEAWSEILQRPKEELYIELQETAQLSGILDQLMAEKVLTFLGSKARLICNGEVITPEVV